MIYDCGFDVSVKQKMSCLFQQPRKKKLSSEEA